MEKLITNLIETLIKENLRVEIVEYYGNTFSIRLFWRDTMFYESVGSTGRLLS